MPENSNIQQLKVRAADLRKVASEATNPIARNLASRMAAEFEQLAIDAEQRRASARKGLSTS